MCITLKAMAKNKQINNQTDKMVSSFLKVSCSYTIALSTMPETFSHKSYKTKENTPKRRNQLSKSYRWIANRRKIEATNPESITYISQNTVHLHSGLI